MSCAICWDDFSKKVKIVDCPSNESCKKLCNGCFVRTINETLTPCCISCKKEINKEYLYKCLTKKQIDDYNNNMARIMVEKEKQHLPACLEIIIEQKNKERIKNKIYNLKEEEKEIKKKIKCLVDDKDEINLNIKMLRYEKELLIDTEKIERLLNKELDLLRKINSDLKIYKTQKYEIREQYISVSSTDNRHTKPRSEDVKKIPVGCPSINCRGFLTGNKCELCNTTFCLECRKEKESLHECNEDDVSTVKLLKKDTKPCPKCNIPILKIDGCDQMFCVVPTCRTTFSWKTGKIETGPTHNPEFFRFMRERGLQINKSIDTECINIFDEANNGFFLLRALLEGTGIKDDILNIIIRETSHFKFVNSHLPSSLCDLKTEDLRFKYLYNTIDEKKWIKIMKSRMKKNEKDSEFGKLFNLIVASINNILLEYVSEFNKIRNMFVSNFGKLSRENIVEYYLPIRNILTEKFRNIVEFLENEIEIILTKYKSVDKPFSIYKRNCNFQYMDMVFIGYV
jgi:hypothetical protein